MTDISELIGEFKSVYAAAKHYKILANQIARLIKSGAMVDESGQVWIKSKTTLVGASDDWPIKKAIKGE